MNKGKKLYEGKAKILYETKEKGLAIQHFKDDATAFNNQKKASIEGKGVLNNRISEHILQNLNQSGIKTHLIKRLNMREQLINNRASVHPRVLVTSCRLCNSFRTESPPRTFRVTSPCRGSLFSCLRNPSR